MTYTHAITSIVAIKSLFHFSHDIDHGFSLKKCMLFRKNKGLDTFVPKCITIKHCGMVPLSF